MANSTGLVSLSCSRDRNVAVVVGIDVNNHDFGPSVEKLSRNGSAQLCHCLITVASLSVQVPNDIDQAVAVVQTLSSLSGKV